MLITMLADRFDAGGVLRARGTQVDVPNDLALRWIGDGVATPVGNARDTAQGTRKDVAVVQDQISGQQFAGQSLVSGAGISGASTQFLRWCIPGRDTSGTVFKDVSGRGNDGTIEASNTTPFAVDARMSTIAHASAGGIVVPLAATLCDFVADSGIMAVSMTNEDPAASESVFSFGAGTGNHPGFYFSHRSSAAGVGRVVANRGNGALVSGSDSTAKYSNAGGTRETHALIAWDGPSGSVYQFRDGALAASNIGLMTGANAFTLTAPVFGARLGSTGGTSATVAGVFRGWQGYVFTGRGLPLNIGAIAAMLAESPSTPLPNSAFVF